MPDRWERCYDLSWKGVIVPEAFCHPAKMSRRLLRRILDHAFEQGWIERGSVICDPFGGIGSTAIESAYRRLQVICVELEPRFVALAKENMALHARYWQTLGCPQPVMLQGDSRKLGDLVREAEIIVGSPPFIETGIGGTHNVVNNNRQCVSRNRPQHIGVGQIARGLRYADTTPGQLGAMKAGQVEVVVGSPPFAGNTGGHGKASQNAIDPKLFARHLGGMTGIVGLPGQLASLPPGSLVSAIVSSPPYEEGIGHGGTPTVIDGQKKLHIADSSRYSSSHKNMGNQRGDTFWEAAKTILEQCHALLVPSGYALWVVKDFVRAKRRVDFTGDWRRLCEAVGFRLVCEHHAMLTREWEEPDLFTGRIRKEKKRASFFRRLAESKGSPRIDNEAVQCFVKPPA